MMAEAAEGDKDDFRSESKLQAYPPSWVDRLTDWVAQLPGPSWGYYAGLGLALLLVQALVLWIEGPFPVGTFFPVQLFMAGLVGYFLALFQYLDNRAAAALTTLRPALKGAEQEYGRLRYQLTMLPARPTLLASVVTLSIATVLDNLPGAQSSFEALVADSPISAALAYFIYLVTWLFFGTLMYRTTRQMRLISRIYTRHTRINLFRMGPLYAFSGLTALMAVGLTIPPYGWLAINPHFLYDVTVIGIYLVITALAVATFAWPLLGIHRLLVKEKERLLEESSRRLEATIADLHQRVDSGKLDGMMDLNMAIAALEMEQSALNRIPTWPWQPETVRLLVTALLLPLGLWIVQVVLQVVMGQ